MTTTYLVFFESVIDRCIIMFVFKGSYKQMIEHNVAGLKSYFLELV